MNSTPSNSDDSPDTEDAGINELGEITIGLISPSETQKGKLEPQYEEVDISAICFRNALSASIYPLEMAKILMQIGYEPKEPVHSTTLFGRPCLLLPNSFSYIKYIKRVDGFYGCFRGLTPYLIHQTAFYLLAETISCKMFCILGLKKFSRRKKKNRIIQVGQGDVGSYVAPVGAHAREQGEKREPIGNIAFQIYWRVTLRDLIARMIALTVCYPLRTIAYQTISEFVGRDGIMRGGMISAVRHIYSQNGFAGFYGGLMPRLIGESTQICVLGFLGYILKLKIGSSEARACLGVSFSILMGAFTYPLHVVSSTMSVCNSGLRAGSPPFMEHYEDWRDCWTRLATLRLLRRGSSLIYRYYTGPVTSEGEVLHTIGIRFGPDFSVGVRHPELSNY